ncbi:MAG: FkbM family methyltransferase [Candidatus Obscuribacterales bacterium]|nr:FkbM family methyltransferase [Candidatus Obscuribacterales bacterium]
MRQMIHYIREKFHPLHTLRRNPTIYNLLLATCNWQVACPLRGVLWPVYLYSLRDLSWIIGSDLFEPSIVALCHAVFKVARPKVFWDIGANIGYYSWLLLSKDETIKSYLFEPDPSNADCIRKTIKRAKLSNATLFQVAASDINSITDFAVDTLSGATGTLEIDSGEFNKTQYGSRSPIIQVQQVALDDLFTQGLLPAPDLIKIDVEGAEHRVLRGAQRVIQENQPILIIECLNEKTKDLLSWLQKLGYTLMDAGSATEYKTNTQMVLAIPQKHDAKLSLILNEWQLLLSNLDK